MFKLVSLIFVSCISSIFTYNFSNISFKKNNVTIVEEPLMILDIPKISFKGNIYKKESKLNNIDKNIIIMNDSSLPSDENGIVIIGGHSGVGKYAYFKNLNKLQVGDKISLKYNNKIYIYEVVNYYLDNKDGSIKITNYNNKNKLIIYTCNPNDKNNYLVIEGILK